MMTLKAQMRFKAPWRQRPFIGLVVPPLAFWKRVNLRILGIAVLMLLFPFLIVGILEATGTLRSLSENIPWPEVKPWLRMCSFIVMLACWLVLSIPPIVRWLRNSLFFRIFSGLAVGLMALASATLSWQILALLLVPAFYLGIYGGPVFWLTYKSGKYWRLLAAVWFSLIMSTPLFVVSYAL